MLDLYIILVSCNLNRAINVPPIVLRPSFVVGSTWIQFRCTLINVEVATNTLPCSRLKKRPSNFTMDSGLNQDGRSFGVKIGDESRFGLH